MRRSPLPVNRNGGKVNAASCLFFLYSVSAEADNAPGELQRRDAGAGPVGGAASVFLGKSEVLHAGPPVQNLHALALNKLLDLADVPRLKEQLDGALQNLREE